MIRYSCGSCGKSLRADEKIIGREAKCTRCGMVTQVPPKSTRKPSSKKTTTTTPAAPVIQKPAISDSNSDELFDWDDSGRYDDSPEESGILKSLSPNPILGSLGTVVAKQPEETEEPDIDGFRPVFNVVDKKKKKKTRSSTKIDLSPSPIALIIAASVLAGFAGIYWFINQPPRYLPKQETKTVFEQTKEAIEYETALFELKKAKRAMMVMGDGYIAAKGLPDSELDELRAFAKSVDEITDDSFAIDQANTLFDGGDTKAAVDLIVTKTAEFNQLREQVSEKIKEYRNRTYQSESAPK